MPVQLKPRVPQTHFSVQRKEHKMQDQDIKTYTTEKMTQTFQMSLATLYRRVKEARAGRSSFPLPLQTGTKKSLRWSAESVRQYLQNGSDTPQTSQTLKTSSAKSRQIRHAEAMARLEQKGVKTAKKRRDN
jgi:predicted DNA-binding transcriptional regulator AlpA